MTQFKLTDEEAREVGRAAAYHAPAGSGMIGVGRAAEKVIAPILAKKLLADPTRQDLLDFKADCGLPFTGTIIFQYIEWQRKRVLAEIDPPKVDLALEAVTMMLASKIDYARDMAKQIVNAVRHADAEKGALE